MPVYASLNSFNAGELSPKMLGRNDVSQYSKGCQTLQNFLVTPYGAVERRPGLRYLGDARTSSGQVRLVRFVYSSTVSYVLEFTHQRLRVWKDGALVTLTGDAATLDGDALKTPYNAADLPQLQFVQSADVMTIVHPDRPVRELRRETATTFTLKEKSFKFPPMLEPNLDDDHTITPSARSGSGITLTASKDTFDSANVGGYYQLVHARKNNQRKKTFTADDVSAVLEVKGNWSLVTHGTWTGDLTLQRSYDGGSTWIDYRSWSSAKDYNVSTDGIEEDDNVLYRVKMDNYVQSDTGTTKACKATLTNGDFIVTGVVRITAVSDARHATADVKKKLGDTAPTHEWNEGAWSDRRGYPAAVAFFEERMFFAGTHYRPQTIWGSKTNAWNDFLTGTKDDDALDFTLASDTVNTILWLTQHDALVIGTADSEWTLSASDSGSALTPTNFRIHRQSVYGSAAIGALMVGDTILFVQRGNRKVREFVYQWEKEGYTSPDMTILADHISGSGIKEIALQQLPDTILWCVLADGTAAALTYEREQEVIGWHRHTTDGEILSCCVIPAGDVDQVYFAVKRNEANRIEMMAPRSYSVAADAFFVDGGITVTGSGITYISGLAHLNGKTVKILADGAVQNDKTVSGGTVSLDQAASKVTVGLAYDSILSPMPIEIEMQNGQSLLRKKIIGELRLRVYGSVGGKVSCGGDSWQKIISRDVLKDRLDAAIAPKNEVVVLNMLSGYETATTIEIAQDDPLPLNVSCIVATYDVAEK